MGKVYRENSKRLANYEYNTDTGVREYSKDESKKKKRAFLDQQEKKENQGKFFKNIEGSQSLGEALLGVGLSGVDFLGNVGLGITGSLEGIDDFRRNRIADFQDLAGHHAAAEKTRRQAEGTWGVNQDLQDAVLGVDEYSYLGGKSDAVAQGIGTSVLAMGNAGLGQWAGLGQGGVTSLGFMGLGAAGSNETQARLEGASNREAFFYGLLSGAGEVASEAMFGGISKGTKALGIGSGLFDSADDAVINALTKKIRSNTFKTLAQAGLKASSEGFEEIASGLFDAFAKKMTYMKGEDFGKLLEDEELFDSFINGTLSAGITQMPNVVQSVNNINKGMYKDYVTGLSENEQKVVDKVSESRFTEDMTNKEKAKIRNEVKEQLQEGRLSLSEINRSLGNEIIQGVQSDTFLHNIAVNESSKFEFNDNENSKLNDDQKKVADTNFLNNSTETHDLVQIASVLKKINPSINYQVTTTNGLVDKGIMGVNEEGKYTVGGQEGFARGVTVDGNNIYINADVGTKSGTQAVFHEIFEAFKSTSPNEYDQFKQIVRDIVGEEAIQERKAQYQDLYHENENLTKEQAQKLTNDVEDEIINDMFGDIAESEDFLNRISQNRTAFQKFLDFFKDIWNKIKTDIAGTQQEKDLLRLKKNLETKFNELYKGTEFKSTKGDTAFSLMKSDKTGLIGVYDGVDFISDNSKPLSWNVKKYFDNTFKGEKVGEVNFDQARKYTHAGHRQAHTKDVKNPSITILDDILNSAYNVKHEDAKTKNPDGTIKKHSGLDMSGGVNRYSVKIGIPKGENVNVYDADFLTRIDKNGNEYFYDLDKIKEATVRAVDKSKLSVASSNSNISQSGQNVKYSLTDSQGRELSPQQQEYFKDSKIRTPDGRLRVMYRGGVQDYTVFDRSKAKSSGQEGNGFYFTTSEGHAVAYAGADGEVKEYYLNITNPLGDVSVETNPAYGKKTLTKEQLATLVDAMRENEDYSIENYGREATTESIVNGLYEKQNDYQMLKDLDYTAVGNMASFVEFVNDTIGTNYDGIVTDYETVVFNSNQIKDTDNTNPTSNPDIRYSLSSSGEMVDNSTGEKVTLDASDTGTTGTLMAIHNLTEDKLKGVIELGGFPVPSIAVTNPDLIDHEQFGNISVLFGKDTINPAIEANEVYDRDVWSPTIKDNIQIDYELNDDAIETAADNLGIEEWSMRDAVESNSKPEYLIERLLREEKLIDKYVEDNNIPFETAYKDAETSVDMHQSGENLRQFIRDNDLTVEKLVKDENIKQKYFDEIKKYYDESSFPQAVKENLYKEKLEYLNDWIDSQHGMDIRSLDDIPRGLRKYQRDFDLIKSGDNKVVDEWQTEKNKREAAVNNGIEDYLKEQTKDVYGEKGIRNDVDLFTNSGTRRKFWALHDEYNLENLVEALTKGETTGTQHWGSGFGQVQATMANRFNSISDIKANEGLLTSLSENNEVLENAKANIDSDIEEIENHNDVYYDTVAELLTDFARGDLTVENFRKLTRNYYQTIRNVSDDLINKIIDDLNNLKNLPTDYFEAKPQRAVGLDEIQQVVIPSDIDAEFKQQLQDLGIQYSEYDRSIEGDRQRVINQFDDLKFSLTNPENRLYDGIAPYSDTFGQQVQDAIAPLQEQIQQLTEAVENIAPITEEEAYRMQQEAPLPEEAPIRNNLTPEESRELDYLEEMSKKFPLTGENLENLENLRAKEQNNPETEISPVRDLNDIRDYEEVGKRNVNAYQYEHPEVKPYFQLEAERMLADLNNSTKAERFAIGDTRNSANWDWVGVQRQTSPEIAELLDGDRGYSYSYDDIRKGLNAIIEDKGSENIAVAKRIEFYLDERLRNGYTTVEGYEIEPNQDYLNMLREQEWSDYYEGIPADTVEPSEIAEPIQPDNDLSDFTEEDINLEPFMDYIDQSSENAQKREAKRNEVNSKKEMYIDKPNNLRSGLNLLKTAFINEYAAVDRFSKEHNQPSIKYKFDTLNNSQALAQSNIEHAQTDNQGNEIGRALNSIFQEADSKGLREALNDYLIQYSNLDRAYQGKEGDYTLEQSKKLIKEYEAKYPELKKLAKDVWQYSRNARHNMRDAGYISDDVSRMLGRMYPHYVPFVSENVDKYYVDTKEVKPRGTIKRAKGGANLGMLLPVEEALTNYTYSQFKTTLGNIAMLDLVKTSNEKVQIGGDTRTNYINADNLFRDENGFYVTAYENGDPITARVSEDVYNAISNQMKNSIKNAEQKLSFITKPLQKLSRIRRDILTKYSPTFPVTNAMKDIQDAAFNSKYTKDFLKYANPISYPATLFELATNKGKSAQFKALYGSGTAMGQYDVDSGLYNSKKGIKNLNFLKGISNVNELIELAPRYAEFKASLDNGCSIEEAMYNAREVTTNFSRGGVIAKALNRNGFTFLNASIQGFDKFIRNFSGENGAKGVINSLAKAAIFGVAPAIFNELVFGWGDDKDEDYDALPDYIKDNYYLIKRENGEFIRIPKGRMLSVFGSAARRSLEMAQGEDDAFKGFLGNVNNQIGINNPEENNIFAPLFQAFGSENGTAWYGGDIIPTRLQNVPAAEQYDASIDKMSIWLGEKTGISPYKINYLLDQYSGGIGDLVIPMMTDEASSDADNVLEYLASGIKDKFVVDSTTDNKYVSDFYSKSDELKVKSNSKYATDEDILRSQYMYNTSSQMAELYKERREIQADNSLTKAEKYEKSQAIKDEINTLAKAGLDNYEDIKVTGNYAQVADMGYYKNANGQWKAISQSDIETIDGLGLTDNEKSEYFKAKNEIYQDKEKYEGSAEKPKVIKDIIAADLTDDAKAELYNKYYKDDLISPMVSLGMDADKYLTYKSQNFTADKDSDGKSISGSKKTKVFNYVNSMNIPYEQKLILVKSEYPSYNDHNYEILEYINKSNMSYDEKMNLIKKLGFKIDGNNVSW